MVVAHNRPDRMRPLETELKINLMDYLYVFMRHRWVIVVSVAIMFSISIWYNSKYIPMYRASSILIIEKERASSPITGQNMEYESYLSESMTFNTHFQMITSFAVLERLIKNLKLDKPSRKSDKIDQGMANPLWELFSEIKRNILRLVGKERELSGNRKPPEPEDRSFILTQKIKGMLNIHPIEDTRLLKIIATSPSPVEAKNIANELAKAYIEFNLDSKMKSAQNTLKWLTDHLYGLKMKLENAEREFQQFKQERNLISLEESEKTIAQKISNFNDAYIQTKNKRFEVVARLRQLSNVIKSDKNISHIRRLSSLIKNDLIDSLYNQLINAEGERHRLQKVYKPKHQKIVEINTRISTLRTKLNQEIKKELDNLRAERELLSRKEKVIQRTISELKNEAMDMNKSGLTYSILKRNVEMNQGLYDIILSKLKEIDITSNIATDSIRILEKAFLPSAPMAPNKMRNTILAVVIGLMIGVGLSFLLENIDRTLHSDEDTEKYLDLPVLSMIPLAGKAKAASYGAKP
ncbi:MAG: GumC family protein [Desulfobacteraceae bacterium]|nr:GumC family protein [Desulfobacteraceae bacterium]